MKKFYLFSIAALALVVCSCSKDSLEDSDGRRSDSRIGITNIVASPALTRADAISSTSVSSYTDEAAGIFLDVEKTVEPIDCQIVTKGTEYTTSNLGSFIIDGYLDNEITRKVAVSDEDKADQHFIVAPADPGYNVVKDGTVWKFDGGDYKWRYGVHHHFWAHTPSPSNLTSPLTFLKKTNSTENDTTKVSFNYTSDGSEDFLVSYKNQYFGKDEETDKKNEELDLQFNHALTEVQVNVSNIQFKVREPGATSSANDTDAPAGRCSVSNIYFRKVMESGTCTANKGACTWDNLSGGDMTRDVLSLNAGSPSFLIPQNSDSIVLHVEVLDTRRQLTRPYIFEAKDVFKTGNWLSGHKYGYNFTGKFIVPNLPDGQEGLDANFSGNKFKQKLVTNAIESKYIKKFTLTWEGTPTTTGNGTIVMIVYSINDPVAGDYFLTSGKLKDGYESDNSIGFAYDVFHNEILKGGKTGTSNYSCTFTVPDGFEDRISIYAVYWGGSNGGCTWFMHNMKMTIDEWK